MAEWTSGNYGSEWHCWVPEEASYDEDEDSEIGDQTIVVAKTAKEAQEFYADLHETVVGSAPEGFDSWTGLGDDVVINIWKDVFPAIDAHENENVDWNKSGQAWLLNDPDEAILEYKPVDLLEENDYRVGFQRDCVCAGEKKSRRKNAPVCPICAGEKRVTRWVEVTRIDGNQVVTKDGSIEDAFADLAAYKVLKEKGYTITKDMK